MNQEPYKMIDARALDLAKGHPKYVLVYQALVRTGEASFREAKISKAADPLQFALEAMEQHRERTWR